MDILDFLIPVILAMFCINLAQWFYCGGSFLYDPKTGWFELVFAVSIVLMAISAVASVLGWISSSTSALFGVGFGIAYLLYSIAIRHTQRSKIV